MTRAGRPRPRPDDPELRAAIIEGLQRGLSYAVAAEGAGLGASTLFRWLAEGKSDEADDIESPKREFRDYLARAHRSASGQLESVLFGIAKEGKRPDITLAVLRVREPEAWREVVTLDRDDEKAGDTDKTEAEIRAEIRRLQNVTRPSTRKARSAGARARTEPGARGRRQSNVADSVQ